MSDDHSFGLDRAYSMLDVAHAVFHTMPEPDADTETCLLALGERDLLMIGMALPALEILFLQSGIDCLHEANAELQHRIMEVIRVQKPHWVISGGEGGGDEA